MYTRHVHAGIDIAIQHGQSTPDKVNMKTVSAHHISICTSCKCSKLATT